VMDVEMPEMNGIDTVKALRKAGFSQPIIMFSTLTERGADTTLDALTHGATAYVHKPNQGQNAEEAVQEIRRSLIPKIKQLAAKQR
jgi:two-component system chemotaxis response regulator CheB